MRVKASDLAVMEVTIGETSVDAEVSECNDWTEVSFPMPVKVKGVQDIIVRLQGDADVEVDWITFK